MNSLTVLSHLTLFVYLYKTTDIAVLKKCFSLTLTTENIKSFIAEKFEAIFFKHEVLCRLCTVKVHMLRMRNDFHNMVLV